MGDNNAGKIFIGGLPRTCTEETLTHHFSKYGEVIESTIVRDNQTGNPRGFGFIKFKDSDVVGVALAEQSHVIDGKPVDAKPVRPKTMGMAAQDAFSNNASVAGSMGPDRRGFGGRGGMRGGDMGGGMVRRGPGGGDHTQRPAVGDHPFKVFIGGLPRQGVTNDTLRDYFSQYGPIGDILIPHDRETQNPKGYAFITFETEEGASNATAKRYQEFSGRRVEVKRCENRDRQQRNMGAAGDMVMNNQGGGFGGGSRGGFGGNSNQFGGFSGGQGGGANQYGGYGSNAGGPGGFNGQQQQQQPGGYYNATISGTGNYSNTNLSTNAAFSDPRFYFNSSNQMASVGYGGNFPGAGGNQGGYGNSQGGQSQSSNPSNMFGGASVGYPGAGGPSGYPNSTSQSSAQGGAGNQAQQQYNQYQMWYQMAAAGNAQNQSGNAAGGNQPSQQQPGASNPSAQGGAASNDAMAAYSQYMQQWQAQAQAAQAASSSAAGQTPGATGYPSAGATYGQSAPGQSGAGQNQGTGAPQGVGAPGGQANMDPQQQAMYQQLYAQYAAAMGTANQGANAAATR